MVLHLAIYFSKTIPDIGPVIQQVSFNTGLNLVYDQHRLSLVSEELGVSIGLYEGEPKEYCVTIFDVHNFKIMYLVDATIYALVELGGSYDGELPKWAGLDWELAKLLM